jgi:hypothetical protein
MSMPQENVPAETATEPKRKGRKLGSKNKPGHHAGRPRKPPEEFHPSIWQAGRAEISVLDKHLAAAMRANSSHCAIAMAIADAVPWARRISVDLQTIRYTDTKRGVRYVFLTPHVAQQDVIIPFDQGEECKPVTFRMKPAFVVKAGARYARHTPDNEQLKDAKLKVSEEQPHIGETPNRASPEAVREFVGALTGEPVPDWQERNKAQSAVIANGGEPATPKPRKPRQRRAKISATKPDGTIPVTLGGKLPPVSVLARRAFGLRQVKRGVATP